MIILFRFVISIQLQKAKFKKRFDANGGVCYTSDYFIDYTNLCLADFARLKPVVTGRYVQIFDRHQRLQEARSGQLTICYRALRAEKNIG
ncbi:hypothetical protein BVH06_15660 [Pseudomonas sp. PA27(2017)]|nr:hypothetical protein BVH06_15660 [Pseudomonas sp. PA27(2017)]